MKTIVLLTIEFMAILYFAIATGILIVHYKGTKDEIPSLIRGPVFTIIAGVCMVIVLVLFAVGVLMWEPSVNYYEQVTEPLFRLKR